MNIVNDIFQPRLFYDPKPLHQASIRAIVGQFFEVTTNCLIPDCIKMDKKDKPDFKYKKIFIECKASKSEFLIDEYQMNSFLFSNVYYFSYFYDSARCYTNLFVKDLFKDMMANIECLIITPAEVMVEKSKQVRRQRYGRWNDTDDPERQFFYRIPIEKLLEGCKRKKAVIVNFNEELKTSKFPIYVDRSVRSRII
jgi:hypothetical protein